MGKGSSGGSQTSSSTFSPWNPGALMNYYNRVLGLSQGGYPGPNQQVAGLTPAELQGLQMEMGSIPGQQGLYGAGAGAEGMSLGGGYFNPNANPYLAASGPNQNPYISSLANIQNSPYFKQLTNNPYLSQANPYLHDYANAATSQLRNDYQATVAPGAVSGAELSGAFGGSADAEKRALNQYSYGNTEGNMLANIYEPAWAQQGQWYQQGAQEQANLLEQSQQAAASQYGTQAMNQAGLYGQQFGQAMQNQLGALGMLPDLMKAGTIPGETALGVGGLQQQQGQNQLNANYQNAYNQAFWPYQLTNWLGQAATGINQGFGQGTQTTDYGGGGPGIGQNLLGAGLGGSGLLSMLFSGGSGTPWSNFMGTGLGQALGSGGSGIMSALGSGGSGIMALLAKLGPMLAAL